MEELAIKSEGNSLVMRNSQNEKSLLGLPYELRRMIFELLLLPWTVRWGFGHNNLSRTGILQACRQISEETRRYFSIEDIHLQFNSTATMIDYLMRLDTEHRKRIRHIRVKGFPIIIHMPDKGIHERYGMTETLRLFPGLQLDCLVIDDCFDQRSAYYSTNPDVTCSYIGDLMRSKGWKEMRYIMPTTRAIRSMSLSRVVRDKPDDWEMMIRATDGAASQSEVKMYVATTDNVAGMAENPDTRTMYSTATGQMEDTFAAFRRLVPSPVKDLHTVEERECIVIATRGNTASRVQTGQGLPEYLTGISGYAEWKELRDSERYYDTENSFGLFVHPIRPVFIAGESFY